MARLALAFGLVAVVFSAARGYIVCNDFSYTENENEQAEQRAAAHSRQRERDQEQLTIREPYTEIHARLMDGCSEAERQCVCTREYAPVCGDDGVTYATYCRACCSRHRDGNEALTHATDGECGQAQEELYREPATVRNARHMDGCSEAARQCVCTMEYAPVCGNDGVTYATYCRACCNRYTEGKVELTHATDGVCAGRRRRHATHRRRRTSEPSRTAMELCRDTEKSCGCPRHLNPVCGDNGKTYGNFCMACCGRFEKNDQTLTRVEYGRCASDEEEGALRQRRSSHRRRRASDKRRGMLSACTDAERRCTCPHVLRQVCGNNGHTYSSFCNACCEKWEMGNTQLLRVTQGICPDDQ